MVRIELATSRCFTQKHFSTKHQYPQHYMNNSKWILGSYKPNVTICLWDTTHNYHIRIFFLTLLILQLKYFFRAFSIKGSQIVLISILGLLNRSLLPNICAASLRCLILQCFPLSIDLTSPHKNTGETRGQRNNRGLPVHSTFDISLNNHRTLLYTWSAQ